MPELPENEAQRLTLERECLNRTIEAVELGSDTDYIELPGDNARQRLVGHQFTQTRRHGKNIFAGSKTGPWIAVHLGMTGKLVPFDAPEEAPEYTKLLVIFEGDRRLAFRCPRKLGHVRIIDDVNSYIESQKLGPDALDIDKADFVEALGSTRSAIKSALMKQERMAGIGNLWSDEILFQTEINPETQGNALDDATLGAMHTAMRRILQGVVDTEAHYSQLPRKWLIRHRDKGAECRRCGGEITTAKVGGRTAYYCKSHQS